MWGLVYTIAAGSWVAGFGLVAVKVTIPTIPLRGIMGHPLPGDGFEQAEADEEAEGGGEEDGPGVGG